MMIMTMTVPVKRCGNFIGKITASFNDSFADSNPATSSHFTFGVSMTIAPETYSRIFIKCSKYIPKPWAN